ncbi:MAG: ATP-grasp domain-containing protein [Myxococcales bacterium]|nr:ATP-grasp domain-containing protein [Myxococcales bacterium]MCB9708849.1 ATP-grasp domain-containing protein [Myxococcales bacterium]
MFSRVLVANRGEIAVRIIRSLRDLGIRAVVIYSDVDRGSLHVRLADEAYRLSGTQGYLDFAQIVDIAKESAVDAVHPGYGFLSENAEFAAACADAGLVFIGPHPDHIATMGAKVSAREAMKKAGLKVIPGSGAGTDADLIDCAREIGFPIMIKAAAGGGGRGMRLVHAPYGLPSALDAARRESMKAFRSDVVYLERAILRPRHVEIQVLGDSFGNAVHLFERDCSIQRRHQKLLEETPAPLTASARALIPEMALAAQRATAHLGYAGAGTMEFLLSEDDNSFYFLEMNTRIQVEHPITELITGLDIVQEQLRVAAGEPLGYTQDDVVHSGHALECRVYAEDPYRGFLPSPGLLKILREPSGGNVRNDTGYYEGAEVPAAYDALISKLCTWGPTREAAIQRMQRALFEYVIVGVDTNLSFLSSVLSTQAFQSGHYATDFIDRHPEVLRAPEPAQDVKRALAIASAYAQQRQRRSGSSAHSAAQGISAWRRTALTPS